MSFALYGPIATFPKTYSTAYNDAFIKICGDKLLMYFQGRNEFAMYTLTLSKIATIKNTYDFSRSYNLTVHRLNKSPEVYTGYGDGVSPRCPKPYGTCASEIERYTYGASTTDLLCPNENCDEANVYDIFYDAKTGKIFAGTSGNGNKLYMIDPETKTFTKWPARGAGWNSHWQCRMYVYDDNTVYVFIRKAGSGQPLDVRKYSISDFINNFGTGYVDDYGERVYYESASDKVLADRGIVSIFPYTKEVILWSNNVQSHVALSLVNYNVRTIGNYRKRYFGKYIFSASDKIYVYDASTETLYQTISLPTGLSAHPTCDAAETDPPFLHFYDANNTYIYLLTYNGKAPVIQYDHVNRRVRIVDYITGSVIPGELWVIKSRFAYPRGVEPVGITPTTLSVSDWTPIPAALKTECLTFVIKDISA